MTDRFEILIKSLLDQLPPGRSRLLYDGSRAAQGYKPDRVYQRGDQIWVVEIESSTSRKGFIGGYVKAQKYFQDAHDGRGNLLFIINQRLRNLVAIEGQIDHYHQWLKGHGIRVQPTFLMYDTQLSDLVGTQVPILSNHFLRVAAVIR